MRDPVIDVLGLLTHQPLFTDMPVDTLRDYANLVRIRRLQRGESLFHRGASAESAFWLIAVGQIKLFFPSSNGKEHVLAMLHEKHCFGEAQALLGEPYPYSAEALTDSLLLRVDRSIHGELLGRTHPLAHGLMLGMAARLHDLMLEVEQLALLSGVERVARYLLRHGPPGDDGAHAPFRDNRAVVQLPVSKQLLASRLNLKPETLSRIFGELVAGGLIEVDGRRIVILDLDGLRGYAAAALN